MRCRRACREAPSAVHRCLALCRLFSASMLEGLNSSEICVRAFLLLASHVVSPVGSLMFISACGVFGWGVLFRLFLENLRCMYTGVPRAYPET